MIQVTRRKKKGNREADLKDFPVEAIPHALPKEKLQEMDIPMLILDGDGIDRRNSHDGQIKTRLEAFLEMLGAGDTEETVEKEEKKIC